MPLRTQPTNDLDSLRLPELQQRFLEVIGEETRCPNRTFLIRRIEQALLQRAEQPEALEPQGEIPAPAEPEEQPEPHHELEAPAQNEAVATEEEEDTVEPAANPEEIAAPHEETPTAEEHAEPAQQSAQPKKRTRKNTSEGAIPGRAERGRFKTMTVEELQSMYLQKVGRPTGSTDKGYLVWKIREAEKGRIPIGPRETRSPDQQGATDVRILPLRLDASAVEQMDAAWRAHGMKTRMEFFRRALGHYLEHIGAHDAAALFGPEQAA
jgi:metal-responsive CopG/Arc/MetJ family transcriptional regulator